MRRPLLVVAVLATMAGCDSKTPIVPTGPTPLPTAPEPTVQVASVTVSGDNTFTVMNNVRQFTATARMQDGSVRDVTAEADWSSSNTDVAAVSNRGEVTSTGPGLATIWVTFVVVGSIDVSVASAKSSRLSGLYRLAIAAAPGCSALPDWAQRREYDVSIDQTEAEQPGRAAALTVTAQLDPGFTPQFSGSIRGSTVSVEFPGSSGGGGGGGGCYYYYYCGRTSAINGLWPDFAHTIDTSRLYALSGRATGIKGASDDVRISGTVNGVIAAANPTTNETLADCTSVNHGFTLTRQ